MKSIKLHIISASLLIIAVLGGQSAEAQNHRQGRSSHRTERTTRNSHRNNSSVQQNRQSKVNRNTSSQRNTRREQGNVTPQNNRNQNRHQGGNVNRQPQHDNREHFNQGNHQNNRPNHGSSAMRPGNQRPHHDYRNPGYQPPRPGGGHWHAPAHNPYYWNRPLPPRPPKYRYVRHGIPTIGDILGLAFGTFIDYGINSLFNAGYDVLGYADNAIYLANVNQLGYIWNNATMYYDDGLMQTVEFQHFSPNADMMRFNSLYNQLCNRYGQPVSSTYSNGIKSISWWAGNNTGYVTLQYGYATSAGGYPNFYTSLIYGC